MNKTKASLTILTFLIASPCFAHETEKDFHHWEILLLGGIATLDADSTLIHASDIQTDQITQTNEDDWKSWSVQLGLGYIIPFSDDDDADNLQWFPSIEPQINVYYLKGNVDGYVDRFYQYPGNYSDTDYHSRFESTRLMFDLALTFAAYQDFSIFGIAGIGPSWNRMTYDTGVSEGAELHLHANTQTNFAYEVGGGINYAMCEQLSITAQYLFTGFTDVALGNNGTEGGDREITVESEDFNLNAQSILLGLRFAF
ncbi:MAG: outer membrane beta-barrel protein [Gammaproteobacteria bacterium]|jgi:hypothetical protein